MIPIQYGTDVVFNFGVLWIMLIVCGVVLTVYLASGTKSDSAVSGSDEEEVPHSAD